MRGQAGAAKARAIERRADGGQSRAGAYSRSSPGSAPALQGTRKATPSGHEAPRQLARRCLLNKPCQAPCSGRCPWQAAGRAVGPHVQAWRARLRRRGLWSSGGVGRCTQARLFWLGRQEMGRAAQGAGGGRGMTERTHAQARGRGTRVRVLMHNAGRGTVLVVSVRVVQVRVTSARTLNLGSSRSGRKRCPGACCSRNGRERCPTGRCSRNGHKRCERNPGARLQALAAGPKGGERAARPQICYLGHW